MNMNEIIDFVAVNVSPFVMGRHQHQRTVILVHLFP